MRLGCSTKVKMSRKKEVPSKIKDGKLSHCIGEGDARWRLPQRQDGQLAAPRVGHVAVLQKASLDGVHPSVLIHGGLDDGGMPLGDTYEVRIIESADQPLKTEWRCLDQ